MKIFWYLIWYSMFYCTSAENKLSKFFLCHTLGIKFFKLEIITADELDFSKNLIITAFWRNKWIFRNQFIFQWIFSCGKQEVKICTCNFLLLCNSLKLSLILSINVYNSLVIPLISLNSSKIPWKFFSTFHNSLEISVISLQFIVHFHNSLVIPTIIWQLSQFHLFPVHLILLYYEIPNSFKILLKFINILQQFLVNFL